MSFILFGIFICVVVFFRSFHRWLGQFRFNEEEADEELEQPWMNRGTIITIVSCIFAYIVYNGHLTITTIDEEEDLEDHSIGRFKTRIALICVCLYILYILYKFCSTRVLCILNCLFGYMLYDGEFKKIEKQLEDRWKRGFEILLILICAFGFFFYKCCWPVVLRIFGQSRTNNQEDERWRRNCSSIILLLSCLFGCLLYNVHLIITCCVFGCVLYECFFVFEEIWRDKNQS